MTKLSHGNLALCPGRYGVNVIHGLEYIGKLVEVRPDGTALVAVPCEHFKGAPVPAELFDGPKKPPLPLSPPPPPPSRA